MHVVSGDIHMAHQFHPKHLMLALEKIWNGKALIGLRTSYAFAFSFLGLDMYITTFDFG